MSTIKTLSTKQIQTCLRLLTASALDPNGLSFNDEWNKSKHGITNADFKIVSGAVWSLYGFDKSRLKLSEVKKEVLERQKAGQK